MVSLFAAHLSHPEATAKSRAQSMRNVRAVVKQRKESRFSEVMIHSQAGEAGELDIDVASYGPDS